MYMYVWVFLCTGVRLHCETEWYHALKVSRHRIRFFHDVMLAQSNSLRWVQTQQNEITAGPQNSMTCRDGLMTTASLSSLVWMFWSRRHMLCLSSEFIREEGQQTVRNRCTLKNLSRCLVMKRNLCMQ